MVKWWRLESNTSTPNSIWKKCSTCKKPIGLGQNYYVCSVSTCNGQRTGYVFCTFQCFETHVPGARHRDASAVQKQAPTTPEVEGAATASASGPQRRIISTTVQTALAQNNRAGAVTSRALRPREVLVIASRLKEYIESGGDLNTSAGVMDVLSDHLRILCDLAIENARADGRKTVMDRDFLFLQNRKF